MSIGRSQSLHRLAGDLGGQDSASDVYTRCLRTGIVDVRLMLSLGIVWKIKGTVDRTLVHV
jgi:hypothetical protein